ncbi:conserved hypothetical protein [Paraburkholderia tropica]|uniref:DUF1254 domain-containing protein n=1 Tax=Paraburkholderia tropica TaxID=92647 RepID=UPI001CB2EE57|nr:DUF1254 domain-containing protein [Paraburkholderia tropica]CAG9217316.1 conserved hypothetical protein [Paraburkholderia tropica]
MNTPTVSSASLDDSAAASRELFDLAVEAVQFALPLYEMARMLSATCPRVEGPDAPDANHANHTNARWANAWLHTRQLLGPQHRRVVTPNNDTLYSSAWLDLRGGPLVIRVPAMHSRYYVLGMLDMFTNPFGYIGSRTTGGDAGAFFVHGPSWRGEVPAGMRVLACPTDTVWVIGRILVDGADDLAAAVQLQDQLSIERAPGGTAPVPTRIDAWLQPQDRLGDAARFVQVVNRALAENPPPASAQANVARWRACGIGVECANREDGADGATLDAAQADALTHAIAQLTRELASAPPLSLGGGWALPVDVRETFGDDYRERAQVALSYIGALGIEEAMYITADCDAEGTPLDGRESYVLRFAPGAALQVEAFWSLTAYERATCMLAENAIGRYSLGDRTRGLHHDDDGGLRIAISAREPADPVLRANWLPAPDERFYLALRLYVPRAVHLEGRYAYPPVERQRG